ncbi:sugar kinase [Streptomyces tateyamensis]|uniref:Sugar kinase n=1 Tax=Streptomyces tateyamensis TaxID=565073 RepID=A0A2V4P9I6_9ACTN|nr:ROK family transcriptional regulator [Streptomyces tateyamensis]PYC87381.1 sugar kinase [Streptomyces tateyamensis]
MPAQPPQTVRDLRRGNRAVLLRRLWFHGPLARQDLIQSTRLSPGAVSTVTGELIEDGLLVEAGTLGSEGGRPKVLLRVDPNARQVIGVEIGETRVRVELYDLDLTERARVELVLTQDRHDPAAALAALDQGLRTVLAQATAPVLGIGVGVPGVVEHRDGGTLLVHGQTAGWDGVPLAAMIGELTELPVQIDNGATTMGQAELWFGAGRGARTAVIALLGSGVGASLVLDGAPYRGVGGSAGEWGHTTVQAGGRRCRCGALGCLEAYVGASALVERFRELGDLAGLTAPVGEEEALAAMLAACADGGAGAKLLAEAGEYLGIGLGNLINLVNPELIVLGGWAGRLLGAQMLPAIREAAGRHALRHPFDKTRIVLGELGPDAVALGAATLPVERFLAGGGVG